MSQLTPNRDRCSLHTTESNRPSRVPETEFFLQNSVSFAGILVTNTQHSKRRNTMKSSGIPATANILRECYFGGANLGERE